MKKNSCIWSGDKDDRFVLDQHTLLEFYNSARALIQQSADWHIATLGQIILIQSQSSLPLLLNAELSAQRRSNKC